MPTLTRLAGGPVQISQTETGKSNYFGNVLKITSPHADELSIRREVKKCLILIFYTFSY